MLLRGNFTLGGLEKREYQGKTYPTVQFLQGISAIAPSTSPEIYAELEKVPPFTQVTCEFDYNDKFKSLRLVSARPAKQ